MDSRQVMTLALAALLGMAASAAAQDAQPTFAERLGWKAGDRVVIFHSDDAGMSHSSNVGTIEALEKGVLTSMSTMMPCAWVSEFAKYLKENPETDNGLHLTFTSEWSGYRWGPLASKYIVPGLVDQQGCFHRSVSDVVANATAGEIEIEMRAQIDRAQTMNMPITHLDTHMGTVYATPEFLAKYVEVGIEKQIPVMLPGGHATLARKEHPEVRDYAPVIQALGERLWESGLPVLDDLFADTYGWKTFETKKANMIKLLKEELQPGLTQVIVHCTRPTEEFQFISDSGETRLADLLVMIDPDIKKLIEDEGIILTTWRELIERRAKVK